MSHTNGDQIKSICELHTKETIFAAAIQAIAGMLIKPETVIITSALMRKPQTVALGLMVEILDKQGIILDKITSGREV